jgi:hypothetical protein
MFRKAGLVVVLSFTFACSSSSSPPTPKGTVQDGNKPQAAKVGPLAACAPKPGAYVAHYTRIAGDAKVCPDLKDLPADVSGMDLEIVQPPNCKATADVEGCTLSTHCETTSGGVTFTDDIVSKLSNDSVTGTTHSKVVGNGTNSDCTYSFTYAQR